MDHKHSFGEHPAKDWPDGRYLCHCISCNELFVGQKRDVVCRECWNDPVDNLEAKLNNE